MTATAFLIVRYKKMIKATIKYEYENRTPRKQQLFFDNLKAANNCIKELKKDLYNNIINHFVYFEFSEMQKKNKLTMIYDPVIMYDKPLKVTINLKEVKNNDKINNKKTI